MVDLKELNSKYISFNINHTASELKNSILTVEHGG